MSLARRAVVGASVAYTAYSAFTWVCSPASPKKEEPKPADPAQTFKDQVQGWAVGGLHANLLGMAEELGIFKVSSALSF